MRVCFLNRNPATHPGGDLIMLECLMSALRRLGVDCHNLYGEWGPEHLHLYDLVVIYHSNLTWSKDNWWKTLASHRPYVVLPIFYPTDALGMTYPEMRSMFENAEAVVPLSFTEAREITTLTGFTGPFHVIPHGTEERFHWSENALVVSMIPPALADIVSSSSMARREFVMCANARGDKGEGAVERACRRLGLPFRYITGVPHEKLHLAYRQAKVFVHSSPDDRMSLTIGEALCAGCRVISSTRDRGNEWYPGIAECDPEDEDVLAHAIETAWHNTGWDDSPNVRAREMTWDLAARRWLRVYEEAVR